MKVVYFKKRMIGFAFLILLSMYYFYQSEYIPSQTEVLILLMIYSSFILNGIGIKEKKEEEHAQE